MKRIITVNTTMKSILAVIGIFLLAAILLFAFNACGRTSDHPEKVVEAFMRDLQKQEFTQAAGLMRPDATALQLLREQDELQVGTGALVGFACRNMKYEVTGVETAGETSTVFTDITIPDVSVLLQDYLREALMMALVDHGNADLRTSLQNLLLLKTDAYEAAGGFGTRTAEVEIVLSRIDGAWGIQDVGNLEFAMIGGFEQLFEPET